MLLVVALVGCGRSKASGPAWPEASKTADDGGESIAPRPTATYAAVAEKASEPEPDKADAAPAATPAATTEDKPAATPAATVTAPEEVITTEEIIIEIDD